MTEPVQRAIPLMVGGMIALAAVTGVLFYRNLAAGYHGLRLEHEPRYLLELAGAAAGSAEEEALRAYAETREGGESLRRVFVLETLEHVTGPGIEPAGAALHPADWELIELEVRRLDHEGAAQEWWVLYAAETTSGRKARGSARARRALVALERHLTRLEMEDVEEFSLPGLGGLRFALRPSEVEAGEWRVVARRGEAGSGGE